MKQVSHCSECASDAIEVLGTFGSVRHYKCRACGFEMSREVNQRPPFKTEPPPPKEKRPRCEGCGKPRLPRVTTRGLPEHRFWDGDYKGYGHFCTMQCAVAFANGVIEKARELRHQVDKLHNRNSNWVKTSMWRNLK